MLINPNNIKSQSYESAMAYKSNSTYKLEIKSYIDLEKALPIIEVGKDYDFISYGQWSNIHLLEHLLRFTGKANIIMSSWSISQQGIKRLLQLIDDGTVKDCKALFDLRMLSFSTEIANLAKENFNVIFLNIHSKILIIKGEYLSLLAITSSNLNENKRIECGTITTNHDRISFFENHLNIIFNDIK